MEREERYSIDDIQACPAHAIPRSGENVSSLEDLVYLHHPDYDDEKESILFALPTCLSIYLPTLALSIRSLGRDATWSLSTDQIPLLRARNETLEGRIMDRG